MPGSPKVAGFCAKRRQPYVSPATFGDSGNRSDVPSKCVCWGLMCVWGTYPRRIFRPNVYISRERAWKGSRSQMCRKVRWTRCAAGNAWGGVWPGVPSGGRDGLQEVRWGRWAAGNAWEMGARRCAGEGSLGKCLRWCAFGGCPLREQPSAPRRNSHQIAPT